MKKSETVKNNKLFNKIINEGNKVVTKYFIICRSTNNIEDPMFGVAAGTKLGNAVIRNKIKRQIRNIIYINKLLFQKNHYYIIIGKKACVNANFEDMNQDMQAFLKKGELHEK